jgi:hypothetical protein
MFLFSVLYLFIILSPFIIISSITLISILNSDFKGLCFLAGLIITLFFNYAVGSRIPDIPFSNEPKDPACAASIDAFGMPSSLPNGQVILAYTFAYFAYCISYTGTATSNWTLVVFFVLLTIGNITWNVLNRCAGSNLIVALLLGGIFGGTWAAIISAISKGNELYFFNGTSGQQDTCAASNQKFACKVTQNGHLIN